MENNSPIEAAKLDLEKGEQLLWFGVPNAKIIFLKNLKLSLPIMTFIAAMLVWLFTNSLIKFLQAPPWVIYILAAIFIGIVMLASAFMAAIAYNLAKKTVYLVTDRRVLTVITNVVAGTDLTEHNNILIDHTDQIQDLQIKELGNGFRDLIFSPQKQAFYGITDASEVAAMIKRRK